MCFLSSIIYLVNKVVHEGKGINKLTEFIEGKGGEREMGDDR